MAKLVIDTGYPETCEDEYTVSGYQVCISSGKYYVRDIVTPEYLDVFHEALPSLLFEEREDVLEAYRVLMKRLYGFGVLDPLIEDEEVIDIHVMPEEDIQIVHYRHGRLIYPIKLSQSDVDDIARRLSARAGIPVNESRPLASFIDPVSGARISIVFRSDVSLRKTFIDIRKQPKKPWTIFRLIRLGTISPEEAAIAWFTIKYKLPVLITGGMFTGKTTMATALTGFIPPGMRVMTIEDAPEIRIPSPIRHVKTMTRAFASQPEYQVTVFDLIKIALRMSVDYIIVGEVRGAEARDWAQAILVGHGGITTFHATSPQAAIERFRSPPISVDEEVLKYLALIIHIIPTRAGRRALLYSVDENLVPQPIKSIEDFIHTHHVSNIASVAGKDVADLYNEANAMKNIIGSLVEADLDFDEVPGALYTMLSGGY